MSREIRPTPHYLRSELDNIRLHQQAWNAQIVGIQATLGEGSWHRDLVLLRGAGALSAAIERVTKREGPLTQQLDESLIGQAEAHAREVAQKTDLLARFVSNPLFPEHAREARARELTALTTLRDTDPDLRLGYEYLERKQQAEASETAVAVPPAPAETTLTPVEAQAVSAPAEEPGVAETPLYPEVITLEDATWDIDVDAGNQTIRIGNEVIHLVGVNWAAFSAYVPCPRQAFPDAKLLEAARAAGSKSGSSHTLRSNLENRTADARATASGLAVTDVPSLFSKKGLYGQAAAALNARVTFVEPGSIPVPARQVSKRRAASPPVEPEPEVIARPDEPVSAAPRVDFADDLDRGLSWDNEDDSGDDDLPAGVFMNVDYSYDDDPDINIYLEEDTTPTLEVGAGDDLVSLREREAPKLTSRHIGVITAMILDLARRGVVLDYDGDTFEFPASVEDFEIARMLLPEADAVLQYDNVFGGEVFDTIALVAGVLANGENRQSDEMREFAERLRALNESMDGYLMQFLQQMHFRDLQSRQHVNALSTEWRAPRKAVQRRRQRLITETQNSATALIDLTEGVEAEVIAASLDEGATNGVLESPSEQASEPEAAQPAADEQSSRKRSRKEPNGERGEPILERVPGAAKIVGKTIADVEREISKVKIPTDPTEKEGRVPLSAILAAFGPGSVIKMSIDQMHQAGVLRKSNKTRGDSGKRGYSLAEITAMLLAQRFSRLNLQKKHWDSLNEMIESQLDIARRNRQNPQPTAAGG